MPPKQAKSQGWAVTRIIQVQTPRPGCKRKCIFPVPSSVDLTLVQKWVLRAFLPSQRGRGGRAFACSFLLYSERDRMEGSRLPGWGPAHSAPRLPQLWPGPRSLVTTSLRKPQVSGAGRPRGERPSVRSGAGRRRAQCAPRPRCVCSSADACAPQSSEASSAGCAGSTTTHTPSASGALQGRTHNPPAGVTCVALALVAVSYPCHHWGPGPSAVVRPCGPSVRSHVCPHLTRGPTPHCPPVPAPHPAPISIPVFSAS